MRASTSARFFSCFVIVGRWSLMLPFCAERGYEFAFEFGFGCCSAKWATALTIVVPTIRCVQAVQLNVLLIFSNSWGGTKVSPPASVVFGCSWETCCAALDTMYVGFLSKNVSMPTTMRSSKCVKCGSNWSWFWRLTSSSVSRKKFASSVRGFNYNSYESLYFYLYSLIF